MKLFAGFAVLCCCLAAAGNLHIFDHDWAVPNASDWKIDTEDGASVLRLLVGKEPPANGPRRPMQFAIAETGDLPAVKLDADVKPLGKSLMIVFAYRNADHFDYAHLSTDTAIVQPHHNGIFHVYGGERVRISAEEGPAAFTESGRWHHVTLVWNGMTGEVRLQVNGNEIPALQAVDLSLRRGKIGIGSFDETGEFKNVKIATVPPRRPSGP